MLAVMVEELKKNLRTILGTTNLKRRRPRRRQLRRRTMTMMKRKTRQPSHREAAMAQVSHLPQLFV
jgi:hypothetical protein